MRYLKNYEQHKNSRIFEKIIDTTGTADKATLDYWNGLYDKWLAGKLNDQEKKDYERMSAAKIYYFSENRDSEARKKLQEFERKAEIFRTCQDVLNSWQEEFGTKIADATQGQINYFNRKFNSEGSASRYDPNSTKSKKIDVKYLDAYKQAEEMGPEKLEQKNKNFHNEFHKFLDEIEIPWDGIMNDLKVQNIEPKKDTQTSLLGRWWNWFSTKISDATQSVLDYLFPEKSEFKEAKEKRERSKKINVVTQGHMSRLLDELEKIVNDDVKSYIQKNRNKIIKNCSFEYDGAKIERDRNACWLVNGSPATHDKNNIHYFLAKNKGENFYQIYISEKFKISIVSKDSITPEELSSKTGKDLPKEMIDKYLIFPILISVGNEKNGIKLMENSPKINPSYLDKQKDATDLSDEIPYSYPDTYAFGKSSKLLNYFPWDQSGVSGVLYGEKPSPSWSNLAQETGKSIYGSYEEYKKIKPFIDEVFNKPEDESPVTKNWEYFFVFSVVNEGAEPVKSQGIIKFLRIAFPQFFK